MEKLSHPFQMDYGGCRAHESSKMQPLSLNRCLQGRALLVGAFTSAEGKYIHVQLCLQSRFIPERFSSVESQCWQASRARESEACLTISRRQKGHDGEHCFTTNLTHAAQPVVRR